ncbi:hypothetical protein QJS64_16865 [Paraclostridium bifermentans]|uniref:Uncharacterized protein n=1 Tax=Paraclostridium bifermentans TaxID=1490 RepID=A0ABY8R4N9_PARBF|nr:hypothetical protein QJS64_16865 [Paraclostridium bifermentans]
MNFLVVSECFLFRNSLTYLFENIFDNMNVKSLQNLKDISIEDIINSELLFLDSNSQQNYITKAVKDIKAFKNIKIIILDTKKIKVCF